jgi:hypothetical protein
MLQEGMEDPQNLHELVIAKIAPRFRSAMDAAGWYYFSRLPGFDGMTAADLVMAGWESDVIDYLDGVEAGVYA